MTALGDRDMLEKASGGRRTLRDFPVWRSACLILVGLASLAAVGCSSIDVSGVKSTASSAPAAAPRTTGGSPAVSERKRLIELFGGEYSAPRPSGISTKSWCVSPHRRRRLPRPIA